MLVSTLVNFVSLALFAIAVWRMGMEAFGTDSALRSLRRLLATQRKQAPVITVKPGPIPNVEMMRPAMTLPSLLKADPWRYAQLHLQQWSDSIDLTVLIHPILTTYLAEHRNFLRPHRVDSISREGIEK